MDGTRVGPGGSADRGSATLSELLDYSAHRLDTWRTLQRDSRSLKADDGQGLARLHAQVSMIAIAERYWGFPGRQAIAALRHELDEGDLHKFAVGVRNVSRSLRSRSYRRAPQGWDLFDEDPEPVKADDLLVPRLDPADLGRPYFEVLAVTGEDSSYLTRLARRIGRLRRPSDDFVYQVVLVDNFSDAAAALVVNPEIQAVVAHEGFSFRSPLGLPELGDYLATGREVPHAAGDLGVPLLHAVRRYRPEVDTYLLVDRTWDQVADMEVAANVRRIFFGVEEVLELHLSILEGVGERYQTPFFDNLVKYAQRPVGTYHALPIARGKSIFKSNWIRDMGAFYGENLFLAESSATTGGLDSLLDPKGNIKMAQDLTARAFGADHAFFATNGTSTSNKIIGQAICRPGDIVLIDRDCHKSHHYACVLSGAQPYYIDAFPLTQYSMYGGVPIRRIKDALLRLARAGRLDDVRMLILTNATFDGHMSNVKQVMEECLAIKPDLVFLWDEAWSASLRFSPFLRQRTAMSGAEHLRRIQVDANHRAQYEQFAAKGIALDGSDPRALEERLVPDPDSLKVRVYQATSVHKSMSALRQASLMLVADDLFPEVEEQFHEAFYTHTSTSPNQQIIASLDLSRRQMELEGYELVHWAVELATELRHQINSSTLVSKYFRALTPAEMIPPEYRQQPEADTVSGIGSWRDNIAAITTDEFFLDPTRVTVSCGYAGLDGTEFKELLASDFDIQINKTSRNSVLFQVNINNTRSDMAHLLKALADISRGIDNRLAHGSAAEREEFNRRVVDLVTNTPRLPDFSHFHDAFRDDPDGDTRQGRMREAFYLAYDPDACTHLPLDGGEIDQRLAQGPELVGATFIIPYPPGFPVIVPGQVVTRETIDFLRKLDVGEIHGYKPELGLKVFRPEALDRLSRDG